MRKEKISSAVIRRLPRYYRYLNDLHNSGTVRVSSEALARSMGLTASQIRQDLSCFGGFGQQGYGYNVERLRSEVADILGMNDSHTVIILGAGNLGRALIENFHFRDSGFRLTAAFDVDPVPIGWCSGLSCQHAGILYERAYGQCWCPDSACGSCERNGFRTDGKRCGRNLEFH